MEDIKKILIIGSGPIIIGQACEFDYSGTQACKALRKLGYEIVLVNSNPATIMTDPETADATYVEPLNCDRLEQIIAKEKPDAILPNLGGQSGLNLCSELAEQGILDRYGVKVIGVDIDAIQRGEDRIEFKKTMNKLNVEMAASEVAYTVDEAAAIADKLGYPVVLRPAYTMGGTGGGLVKDEAELRTVCARGLAASLVGQVLVEQSVLGWEELELEVIRDAKGQMITVCFIENIDPLGVHTGDSFCAAPMLTISKKLQERLQDQAYRIVNEIGVIGGTNVQFAHDPISDKIIVIEINPRTSRSSALASKATGFPIAFVSALLACGLTLDQIPCGKYGTLDKYYPDGDYVVIKFARWAFEKFQGANDTLGTQMRAVGEVMSIGGSYKEAFQKAIRGLETGRYGLGFAKDFHEKTKDELLAMLSRPTSERQFIIYEALRKGATVREIYALTKIKHWFLEQMKELVDEEDLIASFAGESLPEDVLRQAKLDGFSDKYIARLLNGDEDSVRAQRKEQDIISNWGRIHVSGTADNAYFYSTYHAVPAEALTLPKQKKVMILGGGPNRIGQGIEFDYCCVHAAKALKNLGYETIMVNCNPETVSTDYDTSDKLYFEPLTLENVLDIYEKEQPMGVITQFGGQTPLNLADALQANGVKVLGTPPEVIAEAEDRDIFRQMMEKLMIPMPESGMAATTEEALAAAERIGYPVMVRPSFVLGGRGMEVVGDPASLKVYMEAAIGVTPDRPILIDRFLNHALECEADAICDGSHAFVPAVMEHIELAGIHSGDSACVIPSRTISEENLSTIRDYTCRIAEEMGVVGLMNIQYAIENGKVYVIEANPRASRTVPLVSKVCGIRMVPLAVEAVIRRERGEAYDLSSMTTPDIPYYGVKEAVFPFNMFPEVDPVLGPEMRSTGEVLGLARDFGAAFAKSQEATQSSLPAPGGALISLNDLNAPEVPGIINGLLDAGFDLLSYGETAAAMKAAGYPCTELQDQAEIAAAISDGRVQMIINTNTGRGSAAVDGFVRREAIRARIHRITTYAGAVAAVEGLHSVKNGTAEAVHSLQELQKTLN